MNQSPILLSIAAVAVSLSSLFLSLLGFRRDRGQLDVTIGIYHIMGGTPLKLQSTVVGVRIVNSGRRPVFLTGVGFDNKGNWWRRPLACLFSKIQTRGTALLNEDLKSLIYDEKGEFKFLQEGQSSSVNLPFAEKDRHQWKDFLKQTETFYVTDTIGRNHKASRSSFRKLKQDILKSKH